eukprot:Rmarinus@m.18357
MEKQNVAAVQGMVNRHFEVTTGESEPKKERMTESKVGSKRFSFLPSLRRNSSTAPPPVPAYPQPAVVRRIVLGKGLPEPMNTNDGVLSPDELARATTLLTFKGQMMDIDRTVVNVWQMLRQRDEDKLKRLVSEVDKQQEILQKLQADIASAEELSTLSVHESDTSLGENGKTGDRRSDNRRPSVHVRARLEELEQELQLLTTRITEQKEQIKHKEEYLLAQAKEAKLKERRVAELESRVNEKERHIGGLEWRQKDLEKKIEATEARLKELDDLVVYRERLMVSRTGDHTRASTANTKEVTFKSLSGVDAVPSTAMTMTRSSLREALPDDSGANGDDNTEGGPDAAGDIYVPEVLVEELGGGAIQDNPVYQDYQRVSMALDTLADLLGQQRIARQAAMNDGIPCPPSIEDIDDMARYLDLNLQRFPHLRWIAEDAVDPPVPVNWAMLENDDGEHFYYDEIRGESQYDHPLDRFYRRLVRLLTTYDQVPENEVDLYDDQLAVVASQERPMSSISQYGALSRPRSHPTPHTEGVSHPTRRSTGPAPDDADALPRCPPPRSQSAGSLLSPRRPPPPGNLAGIGGDGGSRGPHDAQADGAKSPGYVRPASAGTAPGSPRVKISTMYSRKSYVNKLPTPPPTPPKTTARDM